MSTWPYTDFTKSQILRARLGAVKDELRFCGLDSTGEPLQVRARLIDHKHPKPAAPPGGAADPSGGDIGQPEAAGAEQALVAGAPDGDAAGAEAVVACDVGEEHAEVAQPEGPASHSPLSTKLAMAAMSEAQRDALVARRLRVQKPDLYRALL